MQKAGWGVTAILVCGAWACSGQLSQLDAAGGAAGVAGERSGEAEGGHGPAAGEANRGPSAGERGDGIIAGEGGASGDGTGIGGAAGAVENGGAGGFVPNFFPTADPHSLWNCAEGEGMAGVGGAPAAWPLPSSAEATLPQLVGDWAHNGAPDNIGDLDYFHFDADGTGWQTTNQLFCCEDLSTRYVGAISLADHAITLDSTAGTAVYTEYRIFKPQNWQKALPRQLLRYGYSYDQTTDSLYVNSEACAEPVRFWRIQRD